VAIAHHTTPDDLTTRQRDVLEAALRVLVADGQKLTVAAIAREANCSKETLYKWFGDREGILAASIRAYASSVRVKPYNAQALDAETLRDVFTSFATDLLSVLTSPVSVALNRLGITAAGQGANDLGQIVLKNGRLSTGPRLKPAIEAGQRAGLLAIMDAEEAFRSFYGLVVRDIQIRLLLGDELNYTPARIAREAAEATHAFFTLYAPQNRMNLTP
jgi:AcrR family transcriptional regulator